MRDEPVDIVGPESRKIEKLFQNGIWSFHEPTGTWFTPIGWTVPATFFETPLLEETK